MKKPILAGCGVALMAIMLVIGLCLLFGYRLLTPHVIEGYYFRDRKVYYSKGFFDRHMLFRSRERYMFELAEADYGSFKVLQNGFAKDRTKGYFQNLTLPESQGETFRVIEDHYAADRQNVYYQSGVISKRPQEFKVIAKLKSGLGQGVYASDGEKVFWKSSVFHEGVADVSTFENLSSTRYFRDKNHVYMSYRVIHGADSQTFKVLPGYDDNYAVDGARVYYDGKPVEGCDVNSHQIIDGFRHRDNRGVFVKDTKISSDPDNFVVLSAKEVNGYTKDSRNVYWGRVMISDDAANFKVFPHKYSKGYARDSRSIYWCEIKLDEVDPESFVYLNENYAKDKDNVFFFARSFDAAEDREKCRCGYV